jgi:hypothetical protein
MWSIAPLPILQVSLSALVPWLNEFGLNSDDETAGMDRDASRTRRKGTNLTGFEPL